MMVNFEGGEDTDLVRGERRASAGRDEGHADALAELVAAHGRESEVEEDTGEHAHGDRPRMSLRKMMEAPMRRLRTGSPAVSVTPVTSSRPVVGSCFTSVRDLTWVRRHGGRTDSGETADGGDRGDEGEPEHVEVVSAGLLETLGGVHETGGDVLSMYRRIAHAGQQRAASFTQVGTAMMSVSRARDGGREGGGEGQGVEGEAEAAREPRAEEAADGDGEGGREVTDGADALGAVGERLKLEMAMAEPQVTSAVSAEPMARWRRWRG